MSFFQRAATFAAVAFCSAGLLNLSTPSFALDLDRGQLTNAAPVPANPVSVILNAPLAASVPETSPTQISPALPNAAPAPAADAVPPEAIDTPNYATLSAAVAAQDTSATNEDLQCLAGAVYFESKGEPLAGQLAVANVVINRTKSGRFPRSICSVVTQRGQFSFVRGGHIPAIGSNPAYRTAVAGSHFSYKMARIALDAVWESPTPQALYFHARRVSPRWARVQVASIGNHIFYR